MLLTLGTALLALAAAPVPRVEVGAPVADFEAKDLSGRPVVLSQARANHSAIVLLFLSPSCPYARRFGDYIRDIEARYAARGVLFVGVNSNRFETAEETAAMGRERGYSFPLVQDSDARLADAVGARRTPEAAVIDADGRLRYRGWVQSKLGSTEVTDALDAVLAGRPVRRAETPAFGCSIVRR